MNPPSTDTSPEAYRALRKQLGTLKEVAPMLGISHIALGARERGTARITPEMVYALERLIKQTHTP